MLYKKHVDWLARILYPLMAWRLDSGTVCAQIQVKITNSSSSEDNCLKVSFTQIIDAKFELLTLIDNTIRPTPPVAYYTLHLAWDIDVQRAGVGGLFCVFASVGCIAREVADRNRLSSY